MLTRCDSAFHTGFFQKAPLDHGTVVAVGCVVVAVVVVVLVVFTCADQLHLASHACGHGVCFGRNLGGVFSRGWASCRKREAIPVVSGPHDAWACGGWCSGNSY